MYSRREFVKAASPGSLRQARPRGWCRPASKLGGLRRHTPLSQADVISAEVNRSANQSKFLGHVAGARDDSAHRHDFSGESLAVPS
jgi:hypothetical protein